MTYYFYDKNGIEQTFSSREFNECRQAAKEDGTVLKFRDTLGGQYFL
jgi:hypothetical protein